MYQDRSNFIKCYAAVARIRDELISRDSTSYWHRRNLSGIYIFDVLPQDHSQRTPTCVEDCKVHTRYEWVKSLDIEGIRRCIAMMESIYTNIKGMMTAEDIDSYSPLYHARPKRCGKSYLIEYCQYICELVKVTAVMMDICNKDTES